MTSASDHVGAHVVIIGASLAGIRAAASLRELGFAGQLTVVDAEPDEPYDRPPLSKGFLARTLERADIRLRVTADLEATSLRGHRAVGASMTDRIIHLHDGTTLRFDGLIIATGARPRTGLDSLIGSEAPLPDGIHVLRSLADADRLRQALKVPEQRVAVLGGGFVGTEVAATARQLGHSVSLIARTPVPLARAVGHTMGSHIAELHRSRGVDLRLGTVVHKLNLRDGRVTGAAVGGGTVVPAELVVVGLGATPNVEWLSQSGVLLEDGVRTDASLRVLDISGAPLTAVVAAGDVARWPHPLFDHEPVRLEHWSNATDHASVAAHTLLADLTGNGAPVAACESVPSFWSDQYDRKVMSVGLPHLGEESAVIDGRVAEGRFVVGFGRRGRLVGAVGIDSPRSLAMLRRHIARHGPWPPPANSPPATPARRLESADQI